MNTSFLVVPENDVDNLGIIKGRIADLALQAKIIETRLKDGGAGVHEGALFRVTVSVADRETVDWKAVAAKLEPSHQLVTAYTTYTEVVSVRVVARKAA
jgi:hypothetical protein